MDPKPHAITLLKDTERDLAHLARQLGSQLRALDPSKRALVEKMIQLNNLAWWRVHASLSLLEPGRNIEYDNNEVVKKEERYRRMDPTYGKSR